MSLYTEQAGGCDSGSIKDLLPTWKMGYPDDENNAAHIPQTGGITGSISSSLNGSITSVGPATMTVGAALLATVSYQLNPGSGTHFRGYIQVSDGTHTWKGHTQTGTTSFSATGPTFQDSINCGTMPNSPVTLEFTLMGWEGNLLSQYGPLSHYSILAGPYTQVVTPVSTSVLPPAPPASKTISNFLSKYGYYLAGGAMLTAGAVIAVRSRRK